MEMLPTTSETERELWLRTNDLASRCLEIMKSYAEMVVEECVGVLPCRIYEDRDDYAEEITDYIKREIKNIKSKI